MSNLSTKTDLMTAFKARLPGVHLRTLEESRAILSLRGAVADMPGQGMSARTLWSWSAASGKVVLDITSDDEGFKEADSDPETCGFDEVLTQFKTADDSIVLAMMDPWDDLKQAINQRCLREALAHARAKGKVIVLVGRDWQVPVELQKDIFICDLALPSYAELEEVIRSLAVVYEEKFADKLKIDMKSVPALARACTGLTLDEAKSIVALSVIRFKGIGKDAVTMAIREKKQIVQRTGVLEYEEPGRELSDVGGLSNLKDYLTKRASLFTEEARKAGIKPPKGVLLGGPPGTGKTLTARAIAAAWQIPLVRLDVGKLFGSLVGESESNLRTALRTAEAVSPCVMLIDEIEKGLGGNGGSLDGGTSQRVFGGLLTWMQDKTAPVYVVGTGNWIDKLDSALLRRFDAIFAVDLPDEVGRAEILSIHFRRAGHAIEKKDATLLAQCCIGYTGSELETAVQSALVEAFNGKRKPVAADIGNALKAMVPLSKTMGPQIDQLREFCKTGRAIPAGGSLEADKAKAAKADKGLAVI